MAVDENVLETPNVKYVLDFGKRRILGGLGLDLDDVGARDRSTLVSHFLFRCRKLRY